MNNTFDFLEPLVDLENKITELEKLGESSKLDMSSEMASLQTKLVSESQRLFAQLTPWQRVQLSRHPLRPQTTDYIDQMITDFVPLSGDRAFGDDEAIITGLGRIGGLNCMIIGQQKGKDVHERRRCNFGMPHPEGYRKAMLKMRLAERFNLPVVCMINTPGAFPGVEAEERGQSIAIAELMKKFLLQCWDGASRIDAVKLCNLQFYSAHRSPNVPPNRCENLTAEPAKP